ncbi:hypothetical protein C8R44DRAFT_799747 [Mycena epipterygia]|nr:hypothetical protein C8R44DRAFT_799747 [Mycena epipterygia]
MNHLLGNPARGPLRQVEQLWFKDCGLVIRAGDLVFRVSGEILAAKSPVFQDMLQIPQPSTGEIVDGCPVVHLPDDPTDTTAFLRAIFDSEFFEPYPAPTDFDTIHGVLKLSHKYFVDYLRKRPPSPILSLSVLSGWVGGIHARFLEYSTRPTDSCHQSGTRGLSSLDSTHRLLFTLHDHASQCALFSQRRYI